MNQNNKRNTAKEKKKDNKGYPYKKTRQNPLNRQKKVFKKEYENNKKEHKNKI